MTERKLDYKEISQELLQRQEGFRQLSMEEQELIVVGVNGIFVSLFDRCNGLWNRYRWDEINNRIIEFGSPDLIPEVEEQYKQLLQIVKNLEISSKRRIELTRLSLRDGLFMLQLGVKSYEEFKKKRRVYRDGNSIPYGHVSKGDNLIRARVCWVDDN